LFLIFPTGHFVPRWTRWVSVLSLVWIGVGFQLISHPPTAFDLWSLTSVLVSVLTWCLAAFYGLIYRYRYVSDWVEREQTKWVVFGLTAWFTCIAITLVPYLITQAMPRDAPQPMWALILGPTWWFSLNLLPLSLTIAVMRYRLFDINILINRAMVYGALTFSTMAIYVFIVAILGGFFQSSGNTILAFLATGIIALVFQPLRERLQRAVNRLIYGERDDPYVVLSRLGQRLEATLAPDAVLPTIVETIAQTLKLPYVAIALKQSDEFKIVAAYPPAPVSANEERAIKGNETQGEALPLVHQGETIGRLIFAPRAPGESFTPTEKRLLENITYQAGIAAHAVRLTADLQHSRERLVTTREEERRRLRRDLHNGLHISIDAPSEGLPPLSAAVEVAAYRIALEAITNVVRHAHAKECLVHVSIANDNTLQLEIRDDGVGLPRERNAGVGLNSMRERAEELGGTCVVESLHGGGTRVVARMPISLKVEG
jgi:signal transduction histidine kinase